MGKSEERKGLRGNNKKDSVVEVNYARAWLSAAWFE